MEDILRCRLLVDTTTQEEALQRSAKGFDGREEHTAIADSIALDVVEIAIGVCLLVVVQAVATQSTQQDDILGLLLRDIGNIHARGIALVLDVKTELLLLDIRCQVIDVLHHERPVGLLWIVRRILQGLDIEGILGCGMVGSELTDAVGLAAIGELISHSQHLVGLQRGLQRDIS